MAPEYGTEQASREVPGLSGGHLSPVGGRRAGSLPGSPLGHQTGRTAGFQASIPGLDVVVQAVSHPGVR